MNATKKRATPTTFRRRGKIQNIFIGIVLIVVFCLPSTDCTGSISPSTATASSSSNPHLSVSGGKVETLEDTRMSIHETNSNDDDDDDGDIQIVFSDLDGTLLHYPDKIPKSQPGNQLLKLPPSSTGMRGVISSKTLSLIQDIRNIREVKFVLVSGMRTSTFLNRLPYLPRADAYCTEAGGRIFYPIDDTMDDSNNSNNNNKDSLYMVKPKSFDGATNEQLKPFGIREDMEWRAEMEKVSGQYESPDLKELARDPSKVKELKERDGLLWDFARDLVHKGFVLDTKGYSACFRVNKKQQTTVSDEDFEALLTGKIKPFEGLASSVNLSCIDFYPTASGKKNCCLYISKKFFGESAEDSSNFVSKHAVCLCDDDNDLEMALACNHAYIPEISSESMKRVIEMHPDHFTQTGGEGVELSGTDSTEAALLLIQSKLEQQKAPGVNEAAATAAQEQA